MTKTIFKKVALIATLALGAHVSANAAVYDIGTLSPGVSGSDYNVLTSGSFTDLFTFTSGSPSGTLGTLSFLTTSSNIIVDTVRLYAGTLTAGSNLNTLNPLFTGGTVTLGNVANLSAVQVSGLNFGSAYTLAIGGSGTGGYTTNFTMAALPAVPEPETYAMLLAGLGVMGFVARRRQKQQG